MYLSLCVYFAYVNELIVISLPEIMQDGAFIQESQVGHVLRHLILWRIDLLDQIFLPLFFLDNYNKTWIFYHYDSKIIIFIRLLFSSSYLISCKYTNHISLRAPDLASHKVLLVIRNPTSRFTVVRLTLNLHFHFHWHEKELRWVGLLARFELLFNNHDEGFTLSHNLVRKKLKNIKYFWSLI